MKSNSKLPYKKESHTSQKVEGGFKNTVDDFLTQKNKVSKILKGDEEYLINYEELIFFGTFEEFIFQFKDFEESEVEIEIARVLIGD